MLIQMQHKAELIKLYKQIESRQHPFEVEQMDAWLPYDEGECYLYFSLVMGSLSYVLANRTIPKPQRHALQQCVIGEELLKLSINQDWNELRTYVELHERARNIMVPFNKK
ncbi:hypothetical protein [Shouchella miscanthi]|uniref:Uncharacterized protein n=1 Tax=Shouchella miscanthi TaxID=2598861 RepID=A0ABU6NQX4_9BACI|nr:hypothetical protein [Shouchella miscanthi]MED4129818.1 hypothetical protein [Shouchella miscanthi]